MSCQYGLLDIIYDDLKAVQHNDAAWGLLAVMAENVLDLKNRTVR